MDLEKTYPFSSIIEKSGLPYQHQKPDRKECCGKVISRTCVGLAFGALGRIKDR
jgi:hypothetical protein